MQTTSKKMKQQNSSQQQQSTSSSKSEPQQNQSQQQQQQQSKKKEKRKFAFLPDDVIGKSLVHRILYWLFLTPLWQWFWGYSGEGWEKVAEYEKQGKGIFFITRHTTHNHDIVLNLMSSYDCNGHVSRSLIHRVLYHSSPIFKYMGCVPGHRDTAIELIKSGFWTAVIPGGAEEAMIGHENSYNLFWGKRQGFAHVAKESKCLIVPFVTRNAEEMKFNPIFWLVNKLQLHRPYNWLQAKDIPFLSWFVKQVAMYSWYLLSFLGIPIPVKVTAVVGDPVDYDPEKDSVEEIVQKSKEALQDLLHVNHPGGKSYLRGLKERRTGIAELGPSKLKKKTN